MAVLSLPSWPKTLLLVYLIANLKSLPFAWHIRLLYHLLTSISRKPALPKALPSIPARRRILTHPLFTPAQITTHTPLLETDYNLHKSNSTYFSDLDISRTKLVTRLTSPGFRKLSILLQEEGYKGRMAVALGGVHISFKREIAIYERVRIRSRVLTWNGKWLVIISYFLTGKTDQSEKGNGNGLCGVGLSKYVFKKGRFTVRPERVLEAAGWLPAKCDENKGAPRAFEPENEEPSPPLVGITTDRLLRAEDAEEAVTSAQTPELAERVVSKLENPTAAAASAVDTLSVGEGGGEAWDAEAWSWEEIEGERLRGLEVASSWLALDAELYKEFERD